MSTIVTRAGKGSPLTNTELDSNFSNLNTDKAELSGATFTGNLSLGDNVKLQLGNQTNGDLQIYHDGSASYIVDVGAGDLTLQSGNDLLLQDPNAKPYLNANQNAGVQVFYNGAQKLATTSTGIDVTGSVTSTGLTVASTNPILTIQDTDATTTYNRTEFQNAGGGLNFNTRHSNGTFVSTDYQIGKNASGAISHKWYIGSTNGLALDSSSNVNIPNGKLGIGMTTAPSSTLDVVGNAFHIADGSYGGYVGKGNYALTGGGADNLAIRSEADLVFGTGGDNIRMTINSSGNVGIGQTSLVNGDKLTVNGNFNLNGTLFNGTSNNSAGLNFTSNYVNMYGFSGIRFYAQAAGIGSMAERMRIDNQGNVGIGTSSPDSKMHLYDGALHVQQTDGSDTWLGYGSSNDNYITTGTGGITVFREVGSEKMRLSGGNLLVGKTASNIGVAGIEAKANGTLVATVNGAETLFLNRLSTDGTILDFRKDGTTVGSIGTIYGDLTIGDDDVGIRFDTGTGLVPWDLGATTTGGSATNGTIDLGVSGAAFKDLYLSHNMNATNAYLGSGNEIGWGGTYSQGKPTISGTSSGINFYGAGITSGLSATITSGGDLLVGTTGANTYSSTVNTGVQIAPDFIGVARNQNTVMHLNRQGNDGTIVDFRTFGFVRGSVSISGSTTSYNTSSDERLKDNIKDADDSGSKVDAIQVRQFDWKADGEHQDYGMVAQELLEVAPDAVTQGDTPDDMMGVDYSKLVPMLIKEIQSLRQRVAQLEE